MSPQLWIFSRSGTGSGNHPLREASRFKPGLTRLHVQLNWNSFKTMGRAACLRHSWITDDLETVNLFHLHLRLRLFSYGFSIALGKTQFTQLAQLNSTRLNSIRYSQGEFQLLFGHGYLMKWPPFRVLETSHMALCTKTVPDHTQPELWIEEISIFTKSCKAQLSMKFVLD